MTDRMITDYSRADLERIADQIQRTISFGVGLTNRSKDAPDAQSILEDPAWEAVPANARSDLRRKAAEQLGTVGSGNHYVDVFVDEADAIWVGVHATPLPQREGSSK